jgi:membrane protease YdiL (CAAX protease family)
MAVKAPPALLTAGWEELAFRGILLSHLLTCGARPAAWASSLAFGTIHFLNHLFDEVAIDGICYVYFTTGAGLSFAAARLRTESIWIGLFFHAIVNLIGALPISLVVDSTVRNGFFVASGSLCFLTGVYVLRDQRIGVAVSRSVDKKLW